MIFNDNEEKILLISAEKPMLWVLIRIASGDAFLMSTHNIGFYEEMAKIIFQLSSNIIK